MSQYSTRANITAEQAEARRVAAQPVALRASIIRRGTPGPDCTWVFDGAWPNCDRCGQSSTSVYAGVIVCIRCTSVGRING